ncbi:MAG: cytochrome c oxidase assembly protein [Longimicrobiales bacterium]|nr:cytochrome c oxidase assembly protein [Longimicrobiales bacterium]
MQWWCAAQGVPWTWSWQAYPGVWLFVLALAGGYRLLRARWPEADRARFRGWMFALGTAALWIALDWPVGALGAGYLASVHMVQYLLIALIAPPLLLLGLPRGLYRALAASRPAPLLRALTHPIPAVAVFVALMAWTHWPPVVDTLMVSQAGSFLLDVVWLLSGVVFWWPVVAPEPDRPWLREPAKVGYLIVATLVNTGVFAYLTFSPLPLYAVYELAPPVSGLSTRDDQLLAGLLMKMGGAVVLWTAISILFFRWYRQSEGPGGGAGKGAGARAGRVATVLLLPLVLAAGCGGSGGGSGWLAVDGVDVAHPAVGASTLPDRAALYLTLRNSGPDPVRVTGFVAAGAEATLHETRIEDGVMRMAPLEAVELAPGDVVRLRPGGIHVMLTGLERALLPGDTVRVRLVTERTPAGAELAAPVVALADLEAVLEGGSPEGL